MTRKAKYVRIKREFNVYNDLRLTTIEKKVLGILGMGGIGRNLKKKAEAFGMQVIYHNRRQLSDDLSGGAKYVTFDELLAGSDVLSLNLPLNVSYSFICTA